MLNFTSDQWVIVALIFVLGLLVGGFLFSGGGRKWKQRYNAEVDAPHRPREDATPSAKRNGASRTACAPPRRATVDRDGVVDAATESTAAS